MADKVVRDILVADASVTALVGTRISPLLKSQGIDPPAVTLSRSSLAPTMALIEDAALDINTVRLDAWAITYVEARQVADVCRAALIAQGIQLQNEFDNFEPGVDPILYCVSQDYLVFT